MTLIQFGIYGYTVSCFRSRKVDVIVCGDMNVNLLKSNHCLTDVLSMHGVKNGLSKLRASQIGCAYMVSLYGLLRCNVLKY